MDEMPYRELPDGVEELEEEVLRRWREEDTFRRSLEVREGEPEFVFYEGPPTANGRPGVHHILSRTLKDLLARYRTMRGRHVTRIAGWDTHGLPVEIEAEEQLGISGKPEIEELGVGRFNEVCRQNLFTYKEDWERLSERIGYWLDYDHPYITCSPEYVESVWWAVERIHEKGLLYRGHKVVPYCPRCGTGLSSHEVAQGYAERDDPSLFTLLPVEEGDEGGEGDGGRTDDPDDPDALDAPDRYLLVWTTTPWTLVSNVAVAYSPELEYVEVEAVPPAAEEGSSPVRIVLSRGRAEELFRLEDERSPGDGAGGSASGDGAPEARLIRTVPAGELSGLVYRRPLRLYAGYDEATGRLHPAGFVSDEEGTGLVHIAPAFGAEDHELGRERDLPVVRPVDDDGRFVADVDEVGGQRVKEADPRLVEILREGGLLFDVGTTRHTYPHCWRCETPLIYLARDSWYVETTAIKDRLLEENASVDWHPPEVGSGRMGEWLENNVDWALSRDRYWGTPLPVWECSDDGEHREVLGSYAALADRAGGLPEDFDPHRPLIDELEWPCAEEGCGGRMRRTPEVLDAWFDSGSMPYAQWHYPFENEDRFREHFPADVIAEGVDQTRGWFYSLLALSVILFDRSAYRSVVVNDLVLDAEGRKMSKSRGNTVDPWESVGRHGADAIRFYLVSSSNPWIPKRWDADAIGEVNRKLLDTLRNTYRFFAMYANLEGWEAGGEAGREPGGGAAPPGDRPVMDRWLLARLDAVVEAVGRDLDGYDLTRAARRISSFVVDDLSNWYVRRTRDRFWATGSTSEELASPEAFATLHEALEATTRLLAPFAPFLPDWIHRELGDGTSVHLRDFPEPGGRRDTDLEGEMEDVRKLAQLGRAAREAAGIKVRQPLRRVRAVLPAGRRLSPETAAVLAEELNVKEVAFPERADEVVALSVRPDYGELGPRFQDRTPAVASAVEALDDAAARRLRDGETVAVRVDGRPVEIGPDEVTVLEEGRDDVAVESEAGYLAALDRGLDEALRAEGLAREVVSRIQRLRRDAGLEVSDRIRLAVAGDEAIRGAVEAHRGYVAGETLATDLTVGRELDLEHAAELEIDEHPARIALERRAEHATMD